MSESDCGNQTKQFKDSANAGPMDTCEMEVVQTACHKDITESPWDPSDLFIVHDEKVDLEKMDELSRQRTARMAKAVPNEITIPDPTPDFVEHAFYRISHRLGPVLKKDSVRCFLRLFSESPRAMSWNLNITSETLTCIVSHDALRCAKVVLEGSKMPDTRHANPNCINPHGYFPLHEAAERFSVEMIKLLFRHGASANVRTVGDEVIENLLPLHVAIENTCMHKYLEDNLSPTQYHRDYIYKLIHLLCLPEMKIFLDTIRLLAEKTDNLLDELWNYMKDRKLVQTSLLLLASQKQIRKHDWFNTIMYRIYRECYALKFKSGDTGEAQKQLEETFHLVSIISHAGEALDKYIQAHSEVPHVEVIEHVASILKDSGLSPKTDYIDVRNLRSYNCKNSIGVLHEKGPVHASKELTEMSYLNAAEEKVRRKKVTGGWDPTYTKRSFFPYWRSVLGARCNVRLYPYYAAADDKMALDLELLRKRMSNGPSPIPNHVGLIGKIQQLTSTNQSRRCSTAAFKALARVLKNA